MYQKFLKLLEERKETPYQVSKNTGISQVTFTDWKNGKYTPKIDKLQKLATYFNVPITYFLDEEESTYERIN